MSIPDIGALLTDWAMRTPSIEALALIGSRERASTDEVWRPDPNSDWDFQIIAKDPSLFANSKWLEQIPELKVLVYAPRWTRIGSVPKVNILFEGAEADIVVIPAKAIKVGKLFTKLGLHKSPGKLRRSLEDLVSVIRPGWRFLKGGETWDEFYKKTVADVDDPRLSDDEAKRIANIFICDYIWVARKIDRGELIAAQRILHRELGDTNLRILHECRLREDLRSFEVARRIERLVTPSELDQITISAYPTKTDLSRELDKSAQTCRDLMKRLVGSAWSWPSEVRSESKTNLQ